MNMYVEELQILSRKLYKAAFKFDSDDESSVSSLIKQIFAILKKYYNNNIFDVSDAKCMQISTIFVSMGTLLNTYSYINTACELGQEREKIKLLDYFDIIEGKNWHSHVHKHETYLCAYHQEDLFTHLHLACLVTLLFVIDEKHDITNNELLIYATIAYLHDIGKMGSLTLLQYRKSTSFPFHGEMGAGLLSQLWNPMFGEPFNKNTWEEICRTITIHMCGWTTLEKSDEIAKYKSKILLNELPTVKENLYYLSFGDYYGKINDINKIDNDVFMKSKYDFYKSIQQSTNINEFNEMLNYEGLIIIIRGQKFSNKTKTSEKIIDFLQKNNLKYRHAAIKKDDVSLINEFVNNGKNKKEIVMLECEYDVLQEIKIGISNMMVISIDTINNLQLEQNTCNDVFKTILSYMPYKIPLLNDELHEFSSRSTSSDLKGSCLRPNLCFVLATNKHGMIGDTELFRQLKYYTSPYVRKIIENPNLDIITFVNDLYKAVGWEKMIDNIKELKFSVTPINQLKSSEYENKIIKIKYLEHNKMWNPKWARQCRGIVLYLNDSDIIVPIKYHFERGAELLTKNHYDNGTFENQDLNVEKLISFESQIEDFDTHQQSIMKKLYKNESLEAYLSFKCDGSLLGVTKYNNKYNILMKYLINNFADEFAKYCFEMGNIVISSQGTLFLGKDMQNYVIRSIIISSTEISDDTFNELLLSGYTHFDILKLHGSLFFNNVNLMMNNNKEFLSDGNVSVTLNFEAICKNRDITHCELAISYPKSTLKYLGLSVCSEKNVTFNPHFNDKLTNTFFDEPICWKISHSDQIVEMLKDLELELRKNISKEEFLNKYAELMITKIHKPHDVIFDYEGFVIYTKNEECFDYGKIKTNMYYKSHKLDKKNIQYLINLNSSYFPLSIAAKNLYDTLENKLTLYIDKINKLLNENINDKYDDLYFGMNLKAQQSFAKQPDNTKKMMLINASHKFPEISLNLMKEQFDELLVNDLSESSKLNICQTIKKITTNLIKTDDVKKYIDNMNENNEIKELFDYCLGQFIL